MRSDFDPLTHAREVLVPLLRTICEVLEAEGQADAQAFFGRALASIERCEEVPDLAGPFMQLSTSAFMGFQFSGRSAFLIDQLLEHSQHLAEVLSIADEEVH